jgi:hypothetical protein
MDVLGVSETTGLCSGFQSEEAGGRSALEAVVNQFTET